MNVKKEKIRFYDEKEIGQLLQKCILESIAFGRSETIPLADERQSLGYFGFIYFKDWDQIRERQRECEIHILGE